MCGVSARRNVAPCRICIAVTCAVVSDTPPKGTPAPDFGARAEHGHPPPLDRPPPAEGGAPPPQRVHVVNFAKLFGTLVSAILTAVAILAAFSQLTGYSAYTGDELESHRGERIRQQLEDAQQEPGGTEGDSELNDYDKCVQEPSTTFEECEQRFPDQAP